MTQPAKDFILLVDDDATILSTSKLMLEALGFEVNAMDSAKEALEFVSDNLTNIDLLLTDLSMPEMDGQQLLSSARSIGYQGPIAVVSGYSLNLSDLDGDFAGVLMKPFRLNVLKEKVEEFLGR